MVHMPATISRHKGLLVKQLQGNMAQECRYRMALVEISMNFVGELQREVVRQQFKFYTKLEKLT